MVNKNFPTYYGDYLLLEKILSAQRPLSQLPEKGGKPSHDEMLFIITHQTYELWFKQVLHELDSLLEIFRQDYIGERELGTALARVQRIIEIFKVLGQQFSILETMTPLDFLEFRDFLTPASGFQSLQFRLVEIKLGLTSERRGVPPAYISGKLSKEDREKFSQCELQPHLLGSLQSWLERIPFLEFHNFNFWDLYQKSVHEMLESDQVTIETHPTFSEEEKKIQLKELQSTRQSFEGLFDQDKHNLLMEKKLRRLSLKAMRAALFIHLYREEPILHLPFRLLTAVVDLDEVMSSWRYRHAMLAHRMLGTKIGTGGSSGHQYLKQSTEKGRIFVDFFNLSTFLIPASKRPQLPSKLKKELGFLRETKMPT